MTQQRYLSKIISGGQTGADIAGLEAAVQLGIATGGTAPKGWRICNEAAEDDSNPTLADFGLVEHASREYAARTKQNVADSDGTVWFGHTELGGKNLTIASARELNKPYLINPSATELREWVLAYNIKVLNVAGNRAYQNPEVYKTAFCMIVEAFAVSDSN